MTQRILVPLDQSKFAEFALGWAGSLVRSGDRVTLATVVDALPDYPEYAEPLRKGVAAYHQEIGKTYFGPDVDVRSEVIRGKPDLELLTLLRQVEFDLVVAATHGRGPLTRMWMGSVAYALARESKVPVLLIRPAEGATPTASVAPRFRRATVPLDGSDLAAEALNFLDRLRLPENAFINLVRVLVPPDVLPPAYVPVPRSDDDLMQQHRTAAAEYLKGVQATLERDGRAVEIDLPASPSVATAIIDSAQRTASDVIVISSHGRGGFARTVLGSVSDKVMRAATIPVLVVPASNEHP